MRKLLGILVVQLLALTGSGQPAPWVPLFQFGVFYYDTDLEIAPGANTTIDGPVQANANMYLSPQASLLFISNVTASGSIFNNQSPLDPTVREVTMPAFDVPPVTNIYPYRMYGNAPGTNGYGLLTVPPPWPINFNLYNDTDMIVIVSNDNTIHVTSGVAINGRGTVIDSGNWSKFIHTNEIFYDQRDSLNVQPVVLDVSSLVVWSATNVVLRPALAGARGSFYADVQTIYLADERNTSTPVVTSEQTTAISFTTNITPQTTATLPNSYIVNGQFVYSYVYPSDPPYTFTANFVTNQRTHRVSIVSYTYNAINEVFTTNTIYITNQAVTLQPGIVLSNGSVLPPSGLSIVTPDPAYVVGNWNVMTSYGGNSDADMSNTPYSHPSAIFADAITVLSSAWNPSNSASALNSRVANNDTVNAAFYTGNVPSDGNYYSGGLENLPRFLENWAGATFTFNGSFCCMFSSQIANAPWPGTGIVYNPPTRNWHFDTNFSNPATLPPLTPGLNRMATDTPVIQAGPGTNGSVALSWNAHPQASYTVEYTSALPAANWCPLASLVASNNSGVLLDKTTNGQRYYRLNVVP